MGSPDRRRARARFAVRFCIIAFVGDGSARQNVWSNIEQDLEVAAVAGFSAGQMKRNRQAVEIDLEVDFR